VIGVGLGSPHAKVAWGVVGQMVCAWVLTLPAAGLLGAGASWTAQHGTAGEILVACLGILAAGGIWLASRHNAVTARNVNQAHAI
jgi:PiT family inorganic phosphate transporter